MIFKLKRFLSVCLNSIMSMCTPKAARLGLFTQQQDSGPIIDYPRRQSYRSHSRKGWRANWQRARGFA